MTEQLEDLCPKCGSKNLDYQFSSTQDEFTWHLYKCEDCGFEGQEWHVLKFFEHTDLDGNPVE